MSASIEAEIRAARQAGKGQLAIARDLHLGVSTVRRVLQADLSACFEFPPSDRVEGSVSIRA